MSGVLSRLTCSRHTILHAMHPGDHKSNQSHRPPNQHAFGSPSGSLTRSAHAEERKPENAPADGQPRYRVHAPGQGPVPLAKVDCQFVSYLTERHTAI